MAQNKNKKSIMLITLSVLGSLASIIGLTLPIPALEFVKEIQTVSNGFIALTICIFVGVLALVVILNDRTHSKYFANIDLKNTSLQLKLNELKMKTSNQRELEDNSSSSGELVKSLRAEVQIQNQRLKKYESLENVLLGLFKSGQPFEFSDLRQRVDENFSDTDINVALSALGERITSTAPNSRTSKYVINNA